MNIDLSISQFCIPKDNWFSGILDFNHYICAAKNFL